MNQSTQRVIGEKPGLFNLTEELGNVTRACQMKSVSLESFYRYKSAIEAGGGDVLLDRNRGKFNPNSKKPY